jgi:hypothetical protein
MDLKNWIKKRQFFRIWGVILLILFAFLCPKEGQGTDTTVTTAETNQATLDEGDTITVTNGGSIAPAGSDHAIATGFAAGSITLSTGGSINMSNSAASAIYFADGGSLTGGFIVDVGQGNTAITGNTVYPVFLVEGNGTGSDITVTSGTLTGGGTMIAFQGSGRANGAYIFSSESLANIGSGGTFFSMNTSNAYTSAQITQSGTVQATSNTITGYKFARSDSDVTLDISGTLNTGAGGTAVTVQNTDSPKITLTTSGSGAITGNINLGTNNLGSVAHGSSTAIVGNVTMGHADQSLTLSGTGGVMGTITGGRMIVANNYTTGGTINTGAIAVSTGKNMTVQNNVTSSGITLTGTGQLTYNSGTLTAPINGGRIFVAGNYTQNGIIGGTTAPAITVNTGGSMTMNNDVKTSILIVSEGGAFTYRDGTLVSPWIGVAGTISGTQTIGSAELDSQMNIITGGTGSISNSINLGTYAASTIAHGSSNPIVGNVTMGHASQSLTLSGTGGVTGNIDGGSVIVEEDYATGGVIGANESTAITVNDTKAMTVQNNVTSTGITLNGTAQLIHSNGALNGPITGGTLVVAGANMGVHDIPTNGSLIVNANASISRGGTCIGGTNWGQQSLDIQGSLRTTNSLYNPTIWVTRPLAGDVSISGSIAAEGPNNPTGLYLGGNYNQVNLSGTITMDGSGAYGIALLATGGPVNLLPGGSITMTSGSHAIYVSGRNSGLNIDTGNETTAITGASGAAIYNVAASGAGGPINLTTGNLAASGGAAMFSLNGSENVSSVTHTFASETTCQFTGGGTFMSFAPEDATPVIINQAGTVALTDTTLITGYSFGSGPDNIYTVNISGILNTGIGGTAIAVNGTDSPEVDVETTNAGAITGAVNLGTNTASSITHGSSNPIAGNITMGHESQSLTISGTGGVTGTIAGGSMIVANNYTTGNTIITNAITVNTDRTITVGHNVTSSGITLTGTGQLTYSSGTLTAPITGGSMTIANNYTTGGAINTGAISVNNTKTMTVQNDVTSTGINLNTTGQLTYSSGTLAAPINGGSMTIANNYTTGGTINTGAIAVNDTKTMTVQNDMTSTGINLNTTGQLTYSSGTLAAPINGGSIVVAGTYRQNGIIGGTTAPAITVNNDATMITANNVTATNLTVNGTLTHNDGTLSATNLTVNGTLTHNDGTLSATNLTVVGTMGGNQTIGSPQLGTQMNITTTGTGALSNSIDLGTHASSSIAHGSSAGLGGGVTMGHAGQLLTMTGTGGVTGAINGGRVLLSGMGAAFTLANTIGASTAPVNIKFLNDTAMTVTGSLKASGNAENNAFDIIGSTLSVGTEGILNATGSGTLLKGISLSGSTVTNGGTLTTSGNYTTGLALTNASVFTNNGSITASGKVAGAQLSDASRLTNAGSLTLNGGGFTGDATDNTYTAVITGAGGTTQQAANVGQIICAAGNDNDIDLTNVGVSISLQGGVTAALGSSYKLFETRGNNQITLPQGFSGTYTNGLMKYAIASSQVGGVNQVTATVVPLQAPAGSVFELVNKVITEEITNNMLDGKTIEQIQEAIAQGGEELFAESFNRAVGGTLSGAATSAPAAHSTAVEGGETEAFLNFGSAYASNSGSAAAAGSTLPGSPGVKFWMKGVTTKEDQNPIDGYSGYVGKTQGGTFAGTATLEEGLKLGVSFNYASTHVKEKQDTVSGSLSKTGMLTVYGYYSPKRELVGEGTLSAGGSRHHTTRRDFMKDVYYGEHDSHIVAANLRLGRYMTLSRGVEIKPYVLAQGSINSSQEYTENYFDGYEMSVGRNGARSFSGGGGVSITSAQVLNEDWRAIPQASIAYSHEFIDPVRTVRARWVGAGINITTPSLGRETVVIGASVEAKSRSGTAVSLEYNGTLKNKFVSHAASLRLSHKFKSWNDHGQQDKEYMQGGH